MRKRTLVFACVYTLVLVLMLSTVASAQTDVYLPILSAGGPPGAGDTALVSAADFSLDLPAGVACTFALHIDSVGGNQVSREFLDKDGNVVRSISAGTGSQLTFTNADTGATLSLKSNGSVTHIKYNPDGSQTQDIKGHNVLILFPTDVPPGPSTTLYVGRVVFTVDTDEVFTLQEVSGASTDICAALS